MIYLLYGKEEYLINEEIKKILKENNIDKISVNYYDLEETLIEKIIDDAQIISLFNDKKAIIVNNSYIYTGSIKKKELNHNLEKLEQYILNQNKETILIFTILEDKLDERKKIVKLIKEKGQIKEFSSIVNLNSYVKTKFEGYKINNEEINILINRVGNDISILNNEIDKLKSYKIDDKIITKQDVNNLTHKNIETDIFKFIDDIILKRKEEAILIFDELIKDGEEPIKIIIIIANKIRMMYQAKELYKKGYKESDVISMIGAHPFAIKKALEASRNYDSKTLLIYLEKLADLDRDIKLGNIDPILAINLFILAI